MNNPRITVKERNLVKGALRRVFSRSDLRRQVIDRSIARDYTDTTRPRVKTWCLCILCAQLIPKSYMVCDHVLPIIAIRETLSDLSWDELIDRLWCSEQNLMAICESCHKVKTLAENKLRRKYKKESKK